MLEGISKEAGEIPGITHLVALSVHAAVSPDVMTLVQEEFHIREIKAKPEIFVYLVVVRHAELYGCISGREIQIFHTILSTLDNRMIYVPNGMLSGNAVINYSKQEMRRVEWVFGVEYGEDVQRVRTVLQRIIYADKRILDTPAPIIVLGSLSASSVDITVRVWVKTADYWNVLYDINEIVYTTFNKEGIGFPFPQLTVHQSSK